MKIIKTITDKLDTFQQSHKVLAFPIAVVKRYGEDEAGRQAALVTYYGFLAIFPLLMIFITVLGIIGSSNPELEARITRNVFQLFPALGTDLQNNVHTLKSSGLTLLLQGLVLLYGARGLADILQKTFNNLWHVAKDKRPSVIGDYGRSFSMMLAVGIGMIAGSALSFGLNSLIHIGVVGAILINALNLVFTFGLILAVFRLGTSSTIRTKRLVLGAFIAAIGLLAVQRIGGYIMSEQLPKLQGSYGSFAVTLGMLFWIYLQAQILLYAIVTTVVQTEKDWPKKLF
jgi:membrane protein